MLYRLSWLVLGSAAAIGLASEQESDEHSGWDLFSAAWDDHVAQLPVKSTLQPSSQQIEAELIHQQRSDLQKQVDELRDGMAQKSGENRRQEMMIRNLKTTVRKHQKAIDEDTLVVNKLKQQIQSDEEQMQRDETALRETTEDLSLFNERFHDDLQREKQELTEIFKSQMDPLNEQLSQKDEELAHLENAVRYAESRKIETLLAKGARNDPKIVRAEQNIALSKNDQMWRPNVDDFHKRVNSQPYKQSMAFTNDIHANRHKLSEGREIGVKIFDSILKNNGIKNAIYFDSTKPSMCSMSDDMNRLSDLMNVKGSGFELTLHTDPNDSDLQVKNKLTAMQASIDQGVPHPELDRVRKGLAIANGISETKIRITSVHQGSMCFRYAVDDLNFVPASNAQLARQFPQFKSAKIHPLFYRPSFDINNFDERGHKEFDSAQSWSIGPSWDLKRDYTQPQGWTRYGLKVLGKYESDTWLHPFDEDRIWWKAYHGTGRAQSVCGIHPSDAISGIFHRGFHVSQQGKNMGGQQCSGAWFGTGIYCSPFLNEYYCAQETLSLKCRNRTFKYTIMCAVRPSHSVSVQNGGKEWVVPSNNDIRPYGILVKEV